MLPYNEIKERKYIVLSGIPYEVVSSHVSRKQQRKPKNQTKLKNLITKKIIEQTFHKSDMVEEAEIDTKKIKFLYENNGEFWLCDETDQSNRFSIKEDIIGRASIFIKKNSLIDAILFDDEIIGLKIPVKVDLKVIEAPPTDRGNTQQGGNKQVTLETKAVINVPLFVNEGDTVRVNTETGEYTERIKK